jgi:hypothetical protein
LLLLLPQRLLLLLLLPCQKATASACLKCFICPSSQDLPLF